MPSTQHGDHVHGATAAGNLITRLHRDHYGRGATTTRVVYQRNYLTVYLEDIYTKIERTLIDAGRQESVKNTRQEFQMAMRKPFTDAGARGLPVRPASSTLLPKARAKEVKDGT